MNNLTTIILAAGFGKRMKSNLPKVLHEVASKPMVEHVIALAQRLESDEVVCVVGHGKDEVKASLAHTGVMFVEQLEQLGTGHAVKMADDYITEGHVLVLFGDTPLLTDETLKSFLNFHYKEENAASLISMRFDDPTGYGRILRDVDNQFVKIVEQKDADELQNAIKEVNSGIGVFKASHLKNALNALGNNNKQGEYYLTDVFEILRDLGEKVNAYVSEDADELMGVNDRVALAVADAHMQKRLIEKHMRAGVTFIRPETSYVGADVLIESDTIIYPNTMLRGTTAIGRFCEIGPSADIDETQVMNHVCVKHSTVIKSFVDDHSQIGPYAYLRPGSKIGKHVKIGDFVEVKNSVIGDGTKVSHLSYVGDGVVGENVNLGCGVVFVNYDGSKKHLTTVEDGAFVGCNSNLIAPVTIGKDAYVAAGSTITDHVPSKALAIARERQVNKTEWSNKYKKK